MYRRNESGRILASAATLLAAGLVAAWGALADRGPEAPQEAAEVYRGSLEPLDDSGVEGKVVVQRKGEQLSVRVSARGLASGNHGQHIHEGASCEEFGGIAVPLDKSLGTVEDGFGGEFPGTEGESNVLTYDQKGSNPSFAELDLANSTVVVHAGVPGAPAACAELAEVREDR